MGRPVMQQYTFKVQMEAKAFFFKSYPAAHPAMVASRAKLGLRMRAFRQAAGLSASAVARKMLFSSAFLYQLERGEKELNSFHLLHWASIVCRHAEELGEALALWADYNELEDALIADVTVRIRKLTDLDFTDQELDEACFLSAWVRPRERAAWAEIQSQLIRLCHSRTD